MDEKKSGFPEPAQRREGTNSLPAPEAVRSGGFVLDTSGEVAHPSWIENVDCAPWRWSDLSPFEQGYIEALFADLVQTRWASLCERFGGDLVGRAAWLAFSDLVPETLARIMEDCRAYLREYPNAAEFGDDEGRAFWDERQRGLIAFPPLTVALDDAGKVVFA